MVDSVRPDFLLLRTGGASDFRPERLLEVFVEQRQRFVAVLERFGRDDWAAPTRCADWSAHDVVRHLCDANSIGSAIFARPGERTLDVSAGFDPRTTPREWLTASTGEQPAATLGRFVATTDQLVVRARAWMAEDRRVEVHLPYGPMDWTVLLLHVFWDSWLHERDVLLTRGIEHPTDGDATIYAATYGVFIAAAVASMFGSHLQEKLHLGGDGGGVFDLDGRGPVAVAVNRVPTGGPCAAEVADALAGRSPIAAVLADLPMDSRQALSQLADFFNTPVG